MAKINKEEQQAEELLQAQCTQWFWNTYPEHRRMLFHVFNNAFGDKVRGARMKAIGVVAGISDLVLIGADRRVWWIELKTLTGTQHDEQKDFQQKVTTRGHQYVIIRTFETFKAFVTKALNL